MTRTRLTLCIMALAALSPTTAFAERPSNAELAEALDLTIGDDKDDWMVKRLSTETGELVVFFAEDYTRFEGEGEPPLGPRIAIVEGDGGVQIWREGFSSFSETKVDDMMACDVASVSLSQPSEGMAKLTFACIGDTLSRDVDELRELVVILATGATPFADASDLSVLWSGPGNIYEEPRSMCVTESDLDFTWGENGALALTRRTRATWHGSDAEEEAACQAFVGTTTTALDLTP